MKKFTFLIILSFIIQMQGLTQSCIPWLIIFDTQEAIDNFPANYPGCTEIEGDVWIIGESINNVDSLSVLTAIGGYLEFDDADPSLNLSGLIHLTAIGGDLNFYNNPISSLSGLDNLVTVGRDLNFYQCFELTSLSGLGSLTSVGRDVTIWWCNMNDLSGLEQLTSVGGDLNIYQSDITSFSGLGNLSTIGGDFKIKSNLHLVNLSGLLSLTTIKGDLIIQPYNSSYQGNQSLVNLSGLEHLVSVDGHIEIKENPLLTNLAGLDNLKAIWGHLWLEDNPSITGLNGLGSLDTLYLGLYLINNTNLSSLSALQNVPIIGGYIWVQGTHNLKSLSGIENIKSEYIYDLVLANNDSLSSCEVKSICNFLAVTGAEVSIIYNAPGCNSKEEVEQACKNSDIPDFNNGSDLVLFPNPANREVYVYRKNGRVIDELSAYNQFGQKIINIISPLSAIDVSMLFPGLYFIEIVSGEYKTMTKLIIKE